jgi:hypothetical protein
MSRSPLSVRRVAALALLAGMLLLGACSRKAAPNEESVAGTTLPPGTSIAPGTSVPPSTDTTPPIDPGAPIPTTTEPDDGSAFGHSAETLATFRAAYAQAFRAECQRIWASMGGGALADPDFPEDQYTVNDCLAELDDSWGEFADSVEEAQSLGFDDAQIAASDLADPLCSVADESFCWSYGD